IEMGFQQHEIHEAAYRWQKRVEAGEAVVVGVNRFVEEQDVKPPLLRVDESLHRARVERLAAIRKRRSAAAVDAALASLRDAARGAANLMPPVLHAVECDATLGEISDVLRVEFG